MSSSDARNSTEPFGKRINRLNWVKALSAISSYLLQPANTNKFMMIEYATTLAAAYCRGADTPTREEISNFLKEIGQQYKEYSRSDQTDTLSSAFVTQALFFNVQGDTDQLVEATWKRFEKHDSYLEQELGFNVANAILFAKLIISLMFDKMKGVAPPDAVKLSKEQYYDYTYFAEPESRISEAWERAFRFKADEILRLSPLSVQPKMLKYLESVSIELDAIPNVCGPLDANPLIERPIIKVQDSYFVPVPNNLIKYLSLRLHRELLMDSSYAGKYRQLKGGVLEEWSHEKFRQIFASGNMFRDIHYTHAGKDGQADIIVSWEDYLIFVECTTKWLKDDAMRGDIRAIQRDLDDSIRKCYGQLLQDKSSFEAGELKLGLEKQPNKFLFVIMTDTLYPNLLLETTTGTYVKSLVGGGAYPYVLSIFDLQFAAEKVDARKFIEFVEERLKMYNNPNIFCSEESDYLKLFLKPEYKQTKEIVDSKQLKLAYFGPPNEKPPGMINPLNMIIDAIGSDAFVTIGFEGEYNNVLVGSVMGLLYLVYNDWDTAMKHMIFTPDQFNALVQNHKNEGTKCRAVAWEGMVDYLKYVRDAASKEFAGKLKDETIQQEVNILVPFPTDDKTRGILKNWRGPNQAATPRS